MPDVDPLAPRHHTWERNDKLEDQPIDARIMQDAKDALSKKRKAKLSYKINNSHRSVGAALSGEIAYRYGDEGTRGRQYHPQIRRLERPIFWRLSCQRRENDPSRGSE